MTKSTNRAPQNDEIVSVTTLTKKLQETVPITPSSEYIPDSVWVNIRYGLGMMAFIAIPPLIPGATVKLLIMGYVSVINGIYIAAAIMSAIQARHPTRNHTRGARQ